LANNDYAPSWRQALEPIQAAWFLRNTRPKSAFRPCGKGLSSLPEGGLRLMWQSDGGGHPPVALAG